MMPFGAAQAQALSPLPDLRQCLAKSLENKSPAGRCGIAHRHGRSATGTRLEVRAGTHRSLRQFELRTSFFSNPIRKGAETDARQAGRDVPQS